ncbi:DUF3810 domain-containing protein [Hydrogenoanaerobacterium sp.]|uniref:DUF3810 domain-containing protein n=1 Tax=Hydrogenoanaerobacterium sp. TaxID=2953763 RepID=UPI00289B4A42|nr:DUF3810 domain-containing protein [Hydrogenoanaerobacterium sp.]
MNNLLKQRRVWLLLLLPISVLITLLAKGVPAVAEQVFARGIYRWMSQAMSAVTGLLPFSLLEFGIIALILILIVFLCKLIHKLAKNKEQREEITKRAALNLFCVVSVVYFIFTVLCGVNYYRYPFSHYSGLAIQPSSVEELYALCTELAQQANTLRTQISQEDANGVTRVFGEGYRPVAEQARQAMKALAEEYDVLKGYYPRPKQVLFSTFMSRTEITGIYSPFTMEANVNVAATEYTIPATMCHELSHLRGFMREDEANFIAYLGCLASDDIRFQYSGTMLALVYAGNQLFRQDLQLYQQLQATYNDGVTRDLDADYYYWLQFEDTIISAVSNTVNDTYLKANSQTDGVKSYGRMVDLLLALRRSKNA